MVSSTSGTSEPLWGVWGGGADQVWAVGGNTPPIPPGGSSYGIILLWDGSAWSTVYAGRTQLSAVWGSGSKDVWAVGAICDSADLPASDEVLHWDGIAWEEMSVAVQGWPRGIWGSGAEHVRMVTDLGPVHWDGAAWLAVIDTAHLLGVWGASPDDVWSVGYDNQDRSVILHWDGTTWSSVPMETSSLSSSLNGVWGSGADEVWAVGSSGMILRWP